MQDGYQALLRAGSNVKARLVVTFVNQQVSCDSPQCIHNAAVNKVISRINAQTATLQILPLCLALGAIVAPQVSVLVVSLVAWCCWQMLSMTMTGAAGHDRSRAGLWRPGPGVY